MQISLRPYQQKFIDDVREEFRRYKHVVGVAPCGAGKTIMTGWMIREAARKGNHSIFFVHRKELIEQTAKSFTELGIDFGIIAADCDMDLSKPVQIASVQTLARRLNLISEPQFLICDECHHILANTYKRIINAFPNAHLLGVTATPQRMGGVTLCDVFESMVESLTVQELIDAGNLTKFRYVVPDKPVDIKNVHVRHGDYDIGELEEIMIDKGIVGNIVDNYTKFAGGKSAICYCVNVRHSETVAEAFNDAGIAAAHVDGETDKNVRAQLVNDFRNNRIKVLCNAELFGEGFDVPHCQAVILARPTKSLTLYIQQSMRAMRPDPDDPNKVAVIIDHVNNYERHGLPNKPHEWTLDPNFKSDKQICPNCKKLVLFDVNGETGDKICPNCGYVLPKRKGEPPPKFSPMTDEHKGELVEINTDLPKTKKPAPQSRIKRAFTKPEEFMLIAKRRGFKPWWVRCKSLEFVQTYEDCLHIAEVCGFKRGAAWHMWQEHLQKNKLQNARLMC